MFDLNGQQTAAHFATMKNFILPSIILVLFFTGCTSNTGTLPPTPVGPTPTMQIVMMADAPADFNPATGKPQIVEFFAFW